MNIDAIQNGYVLDHIKAGKAMKIYDALHLDRLDCSVAILKNVVSEKMGKKDIIKIDERIDLDLDVLGYIAPEVTVVVIHDGNVEEKVQVKLPKKLQNIIFCNNPRCITTTEQELAHVFKLTDPDTRTYRCIYCESKAKKL